MLIHSARAFLRIPRVFQVSINVALIGAVLACFACPSVIAADNTLRSIPVSCNAVAVVEIRNLVNSPLGRRGKWTDGLRQAYAEGLLSSPPWVTEIIQATSIGSATIGEPTTYSIYVMGPLAFVGDIAKHELAPLENIAGHQAVLSPRNVYFVQLDPGLIGAVQPANRQAVSRWVRSLNAGSAAAIDRDLINVLMTPDSGQIVVAVDLKDMLNPPHIRNWIDGTANLRAMGDVDGLATVLSSLRIARLSVQVTDSIVARLELDFELPIGNHAKAIEKAVIQWLDDAGARPQVIAAAKTKVSDKSISFEAPLDEVGLRRLLSLVQSPHIPAKEGGGAESRQPNAVASAAYYNKVCDLLNSLLYRNQDATNYDKTALWHEEFARRIAGLSTTAVDPVLLRWGRDVSKELIALARSLRGEVVRLDDLEQSIRYDDTTHYRWYGTSPSGPLYFPAWVSSNNNLDSVRAQQEGAVQKSAGQRDAIWNMLRQETAEIARKMEYTYRIKLKLPT